MQEITQKPDHTLKIIGCSNLVSFFGKIKNTMIKFPLNI
jgi:hypothetical protein